MVDVLEPLVEHDADELVLTTSDNPFNPKTDYDKWRNWDEDAGYNTEAYLARLVNLPVDVDLEDDALIGVLTNQAVQSLLENDPLGIYVLV